jgi:kynurenine formamidase
MDYYGIAYHGFATTHVDALCHVWDQNGMWEGRQPDDAVAFNGAKFGGVEAWRDGIVTRAVLLDVQQFRGSHVTFQDPVHGWELAQIAQAQGVALTPGDALVIHSGRDAFERANGGAYATDNGSRPGLHPSCLPFIRDNDVAVLAWDMIDAMPNDYGLPWPVHGVIFAYGVAVIDHCSLEELSRVCAAENRYDFVLSVGPLYVQGGTGSPVNPIAIF